MLLLKLGGFWLLPPRDFPHAVRVTLWITTAIHLDTPKVKTRSSKSTTGLLLIVARVLLVTGYVTIVNVYALRLLTPQWLASRL